MKLRMKYQVWSEYKHNGRWFKGGDAKTVFSVEDAHQIGKDLIRAQRTNFGPNPYTLPPEQDVPRRYCFAEFVQIYTSDEM
jgi:hypothetical protein